MAGIDIKLKAAMLILAVLGGVMFFQTRHSSFVADGTDPDWDSAARRSHDAGTPTIVFFTADWCPYCQSLRANLLARSEIQDELQRHYHFYTVDLTHPSPQAQRHAHKCGVSGIPLLIRYDASGNETDRTNGMDAQRMVEWLKAGE